MKYAQINLSTKQMIGIPVDLPNTWTDGGGAIINKFNMLPDSVLYALGWVPVVYEDLPHPTAYYQNDFPTFDSESKRFVYQALSKDLTTLKNNIFEDIDNEASEVCRKYVSVGIGQDLRYLEKYNQASEYVRLTEESEEIDLDVNRFGMIYDEAEACGVSMRDKSLEIISCRNAWVSLAAKIEAVRMSSKVKVKNSINKEEIIEIWNNAVNIFRSM